MSRSRQTHSNFHPGKKVFVKTKKDGCFVDKFKSNTDRFVVFEKRGKMMLADIYSISIYKGKPRHERNETTSRKS